MTAAAATAGATVPVFDLDGTLLDSDAALLAPFEALGIDPERVEWGHPLAEECRRLGVEVDDYLRCYDPTRAEPFAGVDELLAGLDRWAVCSNKHPDSGAAELARLRWEPELAVFAGDTGHQKSLHPVLELMGLDASSVLFVGDTDHDHACAAAAGCRFALAGWNPRARPVDDSPVLDSPGDLAPLLGRR